MTDKLETAAQHNAAHGVGEHKFTPLDTALNAVSAMNQDNYATPPSDGWDFGDDSTETMESDQSSDGFPTFSDGWQGGRDDTILNLDLMLDNGGLWKMRDWIVAEAKKIREGK